MGWTNFVIVKDWKMIIETHREVGELEDYIKDALEYIINCDTNIDSMSELKVSDITIKELCAMSSSYERAGDLYDIDIDKLFLFWLERRNIKYDIMQGFKIDIKEYEENGYQVIRICNDNINRIEEE